MHFTFFIKGHVDRCVVPFLCLLLPELTELWLDRSDIYVSTQRSGMLCTKDHMTPTAHLIPLSEVWKNRPMIPVLPTLTFLSECQADISVAPLLTKRCETLCVGDRPPLSAVWWGSMLKRLHNSLPSSCWSNVPNLHEKEDILGDNKYKIIMFYPHAHSLCNIFLCTCYYLSKADNWISFLRINKVLQLSLIHISEPTRRA